MSDQKPALVSRFHENIESISRHLIEVFTLRFTQEIDHLSQPLMRWLDFRFRYVDPLPRPVVFSDLFPKSNLPRATRNALNSFVKKVRVGEDINPYQGRGLILRNDSSSECGEKRTDLLWAEWGIHHFHLSNDPLPTNQYFSKPGDYLAFCVVGGNALFVVDVLPHGNKEDFANRSLIKTAVRNLPEHYGKSGVHGIHSERELNASDTYKLWAAGLTLPITLGGSTYFAPGGGISSACTPNRVTSAHYYLITCLESLADSVLLKDSPFRTEEINRLEHDPVFSLTMTPEGLCVYEETTEIAFKLPDPTGTETDGPWHAIHNLVYPVWARDYVLGNTSVGSRPEASS